MNQISGKIVRFFYVGFDKNFHIHHGGRKFGSRAGGLCMNFSGARWNNPEIVKSYIASFPVQIISKSMFDYPMINVQKRRDFYVDFKYTFHRKSPYIMKNDEIPFEFMVQPPLPCCADTHPVQDNNISFQQSLWGNL